MVSAGSLLLLPFNSFAQDLPCSDLDPTQSPCPLDSWVWVFFIAAAIFGAIKIYRQQKQQERA